MEAIILAGGLGTRLKQVVSDLPKPMANVDGKPFLEYILNYLKQNGVNRIILSVGYKWEIIRDYFHSNFNGIDLVYSVENEPLGTGGAICKAMKSITTKEFYILNGDTIFNIPLNKLNLKNNSLLTLSLKQIENSDRYACVKINSNGKVISFTEKSFHNSAYINGGIYLVSKKVEEYMSQKDIFSFEDFIKNNIIELNISAQVFDDYFIDIGIPEDYKRIQYEIKILNKN